MTSEDNNDLTISFLKENNYFGYDEKKIKFFKQGELPLMTEKRRVCNRKWKNKNGI